jgi:glycine reductase
MAEALRVVHYLNQFFGGLGGEEKANLPLEVRDGPVGPGRALQAELGEAATIVATLVAGDNYVAEREDEARSRIAGALREMAPQVVVAGPAFDAGRYGAACALVCHVATKELGIPAVTAMHPENPGTLLHRETFVVPTGASAAELLAIVPTLARLVLKLGRGDELGPAAEDGYLPRGIRRPGLREKSARERALDMLNARLRGLPYQSEMRVMPYEAVAPAPPLADLAGATLVLISTGGIVPRGNPDRLVRGGSKEWFRYSIADLARLDAEDWDCVHRGFHIEIVKQNPNYAMPLHVMRDLEAAGQFKGLYPWFFSTSGVGTLGADAQRMGRQMAQELREHGVAGAVLVAT